MKDVYVDLTVDFTPDEAQGYAQIMIIVASADGALVKEELAINQWRRRTNSTRADLPNRLVHLVAATLTTRSWQSAVT